MRCVLVMPTWCVYVTHSQFSQCYTTLLAVVSVGKPTNFPKMTCYSLKSIIIPLTMPHNYAHCHVHILQHLNWFAQGHPSKGRNLSQPK